MSRSIHKAQIEFDGLLKKRKRKTENRGRNGFGKTKRETLGVSIIKVQCLKFSNMSNNCQVFMKARKVDFIP